VFRRAPRSAAALPLLYLSVFGIGTFLGNLISTAFVGDFSTVAVALRLPMTVRYASSIVGALSVAALHFWAGRELVQWIPVQPRRVVGMLGIIAAPVVLGTAVVVLVNWPMPAVSVTARLAEASFWVFAAVGALTPGNPARDARASLGVRWADGAVILLAVLVVRLLVRGIPFVP
jgi:hypothetical protein